MRITDLSESLQQKLEHLSQSEANRIVGGGYYPIFWRFPPQTLIPRVESSRAAPGMAKSEVKSSI